MQCKAVAAVRRAVLLKRCDCVLKRCGALEYSSNDAKRWAGTAVAVRSGRKSKAKRASGM